MSLILNYLPFTISVMTGMLLIKITFRKSEEVGFPLLLFLGGGLGLGLNAQIAFLSFIVFDSLKNNFVIVLNLSILIYLIFAWIFFRTKEKKNLLPQRTFSLKTALTAIIPMTVLIVSALPLWYQSAFYSYGGWDAWSAWNLKAKFLFLGGEEWQDMFDPLLWRSSPHYPLLLPLVNVWGWIFLKDPTYHVTVFTAFFFTFSAVGLLYAGLKSLTGTHFALLPAVLLLTLPFFDKLSLSQYCDNVLGYYLLASFLCLILAKEKNCAKFSFFAGVCTGFLSFTKSEGLIAALIIGLLSIPYLFWKTDRTSSKKMIFGFFGGLLLGSLNTVIFNLFFAPQNITFINGLFSAENPVTFKRLQIILGFYFFEMFTPLWNVYLFLTQKGNFLEPKWHGLWIMAAAGILLFARRSLDQKLIILPLFFTFYTAVITFYYLTNTYFEIAWWLQVTLHRILFAVLPTIVFWVFYAVWGERN